MGKKTLVLVMSTHLILMPQVFEVKHSFTELFPELDSQKESYSFPNVNAVPLTLEFFKTLGFTTSL